MKKRARRLVEEKLIFGGKSPSHVFRPHCHLGVAEALHRMQCELDGDEFQISPMFEGRRDLMEWRGLDFLSQSKHSLVLFVAFQTDPCCIMVSVRVCVCV